MGNLFKKKEETGAAKAESKPQVEERRKYGRKKVHIDTFLYPIKSPPMQVTIVDISPGGVKIHCRGRLVVGDKVEVALYSEGIVSKSIVTIRWEGRAETGYFYGAEFISDPKQQAFIMKYLKTLV